jgi:hypothetical protein
MIDGGVDNHGLVSPGMSSGSLNFDFYTQYGDGELLIELDSLTSYDQLLVSADVALAGTLTVSLLDGFVPSLGQSFTILTADDVVGTFTTETLPSLPNPYIAFDVIYNPQSVVLTVVPALPGDFNADGVVDTADFVVWSKGILPPNAPTDYNTWRQHFAESISGAGSNQENPAVPEPTSLALLIMIAAFGMSRHPAGLIHTPV